MAQNSANATEMLDALAVIGQADRSTLSTMLNKAVPPVLFERVVESSQVQFMDGQAMLNSDAAARHLQALEARDFLHFVSLHKRALLIVSPSEAESGGGRSNETGYSELFVRLAEKLVYRDPKQLLRLIAKLDQFWGLTNLPFLVPFYIGVAQRTEGRILEAIITLETLLNEPELNIRLCGRTLNALAVCFVLQSRWQAALDGFQDSLAVWERLADPEQEAKVHLNLGITAYELQDYPAAESSLGRAADLFLEAESTSWQAAVDHEFGLIFRDQGRWDEALAAYRRCIARREEEGDDDRSGMALNNMGDVLMLQGDLAGAERLFHQALSRMGTQTYRIDTLLNLSFAAQVREEFDESLGYARQALAIAQSIQRHDALPVIYYRLGELEKRRGSASRALQHMADAIDAVENARSPLRDESFRIGLMGRWQQLYEATVLLQIEQGDIKAAFTTTEQARARGFLDLLNSEQTREFQGETSLSLEDIQASLSPGTGLISYFVTGQPGSSANLLNSIAPENAYLRGHFLPPSTIHALVITTERVAVFPINISMSLLIAQCFNRSDGRVRGIMALPGRRLRPMRHWEELGSILLAPLAKALRQVRHVVIIPHDALHYLPLHAIHDLDSVTGVSGTSVSYAPSASIFIKKQHSASPLKLKQNDPDDGYQETEILAVGVDENGLEHAQAEAKSVAKLLGGRTLLGASAQVSTVSQELPACHVVHFSCHGHFRRPTPMDSALQLADGDLTAMMILGLAPLRTNLIVLSACDTGLNMLAPGDELMGLSRAFLGKGADSLLVTLWPVHEVPTRFFMEHFYRKLQQGTDKSSALRAAADFLRTITLDGVTDGLRGYGLSSVAAGELVSLFMAMNPGPNPFEHPTYWAGFLLIGNPA